MNLKILFIALIVSLPFWWGINVFQENLEGFLFAQISQPFQQESAIYEDFLYQHKQKLISEFQKQDIKAKSAISVKIDRQGNQTVLFEKDSDKVLPIASLTKLLTAFMVFKYPEYYDFSEPVTISKQAVSQAENFGELKSGEKILIEDLLHIMLIESSNDAAYALAEVIGKQAGLQPEKREELFVTLMNLEAEKNLGLRKAKFVNSTGLDSENSDEPKNVFTAKDLLKLSKAILQVYPEIFEISSKLSYEVLDSSGDFHHLALNKNKLLDPNSEVCIKDKQWLKQIPNIVGGKTGYTDEAGGCIILVLKNKKGEHFINIILGTENHEIRFEEMKNLVKCTINF